MDLLDLIKEEKNHQEVLAVKVQNADMKAEVESVIQNGLSGAIMGYGVPFEQGNQISQADTMFASARWYLISNFRQVLSEMYVENGLIQAIVDVPVDDGFRGGVTIKTEQLDEDDIKKLETFMSEQNDLINCAQAMKWSRLFGGGGILIITGQDPTTELKIVEGEKVEFKAVDMWELYGDLQNQNASGDAQVYGYLKEAEFYYYYGHKVHHSRVLRVKGREAPSFLRARLRGWGFSVLESFIRSINQYLKATDLTFEVLDEFKLDIYKIKGLTNALLSPTGERKIVDRVALANRQKSYQNAITMDAEDDYVQKQLSFAGISETLDGIRTQVASDLRMPQTKIFGVSSAGFNSGEDDIENYNSMVESEIRTKIKFHIVKMIKLRCQQLFGIVPDDIEIEFQPLRVLSSEQMENVKNNKFQRVLQARQAGEITPEEFRTIINKEDLLCTKLEEGEDVMASLEKIRPTKEDISAGTTASVPESKQAPKEY